MTEAGKPILEVLKTLQGNPKALDGLNPLRGPGHILFGVR